MNKSEMQVAQTMAEFAANSMEMAGNTTMFLKALTQLFLEYLRHDDVRDMMMDFYNKGMELTKDLEPGEKLGIVAYDIQPEYAKQLKDICEREKIAIMNTKVNAFDMVMDGKGDSIETVKDSVWIYTSQKEKFHLAVAEAKARSGFEQEIPREYANALVDKFRDTENPMVEIKNLTPEQYILLRQDIQKLSPEMRFTLFPKVNEQDGVKTIDVGFLSKTEKLYDKKGNVLKEPQQYDTKELMKALLFKQKVLQKSEIGKQYFDIIRNKDNFKDKMINQLLENLAPQKQEIINRIARLNISQNEKEELLDLANKFKNTPELKDDFVSAIKASSLGDKVKDSLVQMIEDTQKEAYIIPAKMVIDNNGEIQYEAELRDSISLTENMTIRTAGNQDLVISDRESMRNNLDKKLNELTEKGKDAGKYTFIVLTKDEFKNIEAANSNYIGVKNRLRKKKIEFLKDFDGKDYFLSDDKSPEIAKTDLLIDKINEKKEKFMLLSEQDKTGIERFDEHHDAIVNEIINEENEKDVQEDVKEEVHKEEIINEALEEIDKVEIDPVDVDGFSQYIEKEIASVDEKEQDISQDRGIDDTDRDEMELDAIEFN